MCQLIGTCGHEPLVAFSCQLRCVCPSCQQKRAKILCRFVIDEIIDDLLARQKAEEPLWKEIAV